MSDERRTSLLGWGFRLLVLGLTALWLVLPPKPASPSASKVLQEASR